MSGDAISLSFNMVDVLLNSTIDDSSIFSSDQQAQLMALVISNLYVASQPRNTTEVALPYIYRLLNKVAHGKFASDYETLISTKAFGMIVKKDYGSFLDNQTFANNESMIALPSLSDTLDYSGVYSTHSVLSGFESL